MKAVILAGGLGTRLKPFTEVIPKPLLPIGEKAVMQIQIEHLKVHGFDEIYLATNYKSDYIENFFGNGSRLGVKMHYSKEDKPLGSAGPLRLLKDELKEPFLVMNGDILSNVDFRKLYTFSLQKNALLTITIKKEITPYRFGNISFEGDHVTDIVEKPDFITYILAGIYIMQPGIMDYIPENEHYGMDKLIKKLLEEKQGVLKYELSEYWLDIGKYDDFQKAQDDYKRHFTD